MIDAPTAAARLTFCGVVRSSNAAVVTQRPPPPYKHGSRSHLGCGTQSDRNLGHVVNLPRSSVHDKVVRLVIRQGQADAVHAIKRDCRGEGKPLVAVNERVVASEGVQ